MILYVSTSNDPSTPGTSIRITFLFRHRKMSSSLTNDLQVFIESICYLLNVELKKIF
jgi:hypothetical protein